MHFALLHPDRVSELVIVEGGLLAPLASVYRNPEWEGWPYVTGTIQALLGRPIPDENRCDLEYLVRQLIEIPIQYGPARGRPRDEEIVFRVAFKPTATILQPQKTVDVRGAATELIGRGRHDPCVVPRAVPIVEAMAALVLADHWMRQGAQCGVFKF